jgi:hypothetical protein
MQPLRGVRPYLTPQLKVPLMTNKGLGCLVLLLPARSVTAHRVEEPYGGRLILCQ